MVMIDGKFLPVRNFFADRASPILRSKQFLIPLPGNVILDSEFSPEMIFRVVSFPMLSTCCEEHPLIDANALLTARL
jgi:hypothetical protein